MLSWLENQWVRLALTTTVVGGVAFAFGFDKGIKSEVNRSAAVSLVALNQHTIKSNVNLAQVESKNMELIKQVTKLEEQLKYEKDNLNRTNTIRGNFVRVVSSDRLSSGSAAAKSESTTVSDSESVVAAGVAEYIIQLKNHDDQCVAQQNACVNELP